MPQKAKRGLSALCGVRGIGDWEGRGGMAVLRPGGATVYSCRRILLYSPGEIRVLSGGRCVSELGEDLHCVSFSGGTVLIRGAIHAVSYPAGAQAEEGRK